MTLTVNPPTGTIRARALVGFYHRGELVAPGEVVTVPIADFALLKMYHQAEEATEPAPAPESQEPSPAPESQAEPERKRR